MLIEKIVSKVTSGYKAVTAFAVLFVPFAVATAADPDVQAALPEGWSKWLVVTGIPAIVGFATWLKKNQYTVDEAAKLLEEAQKRARLGKDF